MSYIAEIGGVTIVVVFLASLAHSALGVRRYTRFAPGSGRCHCLVRHRAGPRSCFCSSSSVRSFFS